jgi:hypothetical protein
LSASHDEHSVLTGCDSSKACLKVNESVCMPCQSQSVNPAHNLRASILLRTRRKSPSIFSLHSSLQPILPRSILFKSFNIQMSFPHDYFVNLLVSQKLVGRDRLAAAFAVCHHRLTPIPHAELHQSAPDHSLILLALFFDLISSATCNLPI